MAETRQPGDGEEQVPGEGEAAATQETPQVQAEETDTAALPTATPGRGTAAPLGTVGEGRYRLTGRLGRGGMAEVFAAQDIRLGRTVAVKLLRPELSQDDIARQRFTREAHSVASLNHHSIVAVYDTGEELHDGESTPYIVMELVEGRTVRELLSDEDAPPVDQALIIVAGVLEALAYSHRHGIVHRDIKPANVIITTTGAVKVMDFGIARALTGAAATMTQTGMVMGTPQYLSPEQALGKPVDHRSDLYAAGCMLYELLTLRPPFTGDTPLAVVYQHVQDNPEPPSRANSRVPAQLDALVLRSLAKNPDERFQSADEFRAHVQHALDEFRAHVQHALREMHAAGYVAPAGGAAESTAPTERLSAVGGAEETAVLRAPFQTPVTPYPAVSGGQGGYGGYEGGDGEEPDRRRGPWPWVIGAALLLAAAGIGIGLALNNSGSHSNLPGVTSSSQSPSASTPESPSQAPTRSQTSRQPTESSFSPSRSASATASRTASPTASPTETASPTSSGSASASPTASSSPTAAATTQAPPPLPSPSGSIKVSPGATAH